MVGPGADYGARCARPDYVYGKKSGAVGKKGKESLNKKKRNINKKQRIPKETRIVGGVLLQKDIK